jgi:large subunit ribosomal protein L4
MPTAKVRNLSNKEVGEVELSDAVFGVELNEPLIHSAVRNYLANARQGTSATKTRGDVSGGGKKPWKQKGTGRARVASNRSPLWRGGGRVHGPQPRDWSYKMPKKMRRGALRSALSERLREGNIVIIEDFSIDNPRTKDFVSVLTTLGFAGEKKPTKVLIVDSLDNQNLILSSRNVQKTKVTNGYGLNIYDLIYHEKLIISKAALEELNHLLDPKREKSNEDSEVEVKAEAKPKAKNEAKPKAEKAESEKEAKPKKEKTEKAKDAPVEEVENNETEEATENE